MARNRCTYYFEITKDCTDGIDTWSTGVYSSEGYMGGYLIGWQSRVNRLSTRVWRQGPKGGVKVMKDKTRNHRGYVTSNEEMMKKFIWVKLKAKPVK